MALRGSKAPEGESPRLLPFVVSPDASLPSAQDGWTVWGADHEGCPRATHVGRGKASRLPRVACCRLQADSPSLRALLLSLAIVPVFSGYLAFDVPSIASHALLQALGLSHAQLSALFAVYAAPNAVLPLLCAFLFTSLGVWRACLALSACIAVGGALCALALRMGQGQAAYPLLLTGRLLHGIGGESIFVGIDLLATAWCAAGGELGLAYGLIQAAGQAGSLAAFLLLPYLLPHEGDAVESSDIAPVFLLAFLLACASFLSLACAWWLETCAAGGTEDVEVDEQEQEGLSSVPSTEALWQVDAVEDGAGVGRGKGQALELALVSAAITAYSAVYYSFLALGTAWLQLPTEAGGHGMGTVQAGRTMALVSLSSCLLSPLAGYGLDKSGYRASIATGVFALSSASFLLLLLFSRELRLLHVPGQAQVGLPVALSGVCYALLPCTLYPMVAELVPPQDFTPVYARLSAAVNLALSLAYYGLGQLLGVPGAGPGAGWYRAPGHALLLVYIGLTALGTCLCAVVTVRRWGRGQLRWGPVLLHMQHMEKQQRQGEEREETEEEEEEEEEEEDVLWLASPGLRAPLLAPLLLPASGQQAPATTTKTTPTGMPLVVRAQGPTTATSTSTLSLLSHPDIALTLAQTAPAPSAMPSPGRGDAAAPVPVVPALPSPMSPLPPLCTRMHAHTPLLHVYTGQSVRERLGHALPLQYMHAGHRAGRGSTAAVVGHHYVFPLPPPLPTTSTAPGPAPGPAYPH